MSIYYTIGGAMAEEVKAQQFVWLDFIGRGFKTRSPGRIYVSVVTGFVAY